MGTVADFFRAQGIPLAIKQKEQMLALDAKFEACQAQMTRLQAENQNLRAQVEPLKKQVERLKEQIKEYTASSSEKNVVHLKLDDVQETFLSYMASVKSHHRTTKWIADAIRQIHPDAQMSELKAEVYLKRLEKLELVRYVPGGWSYGDKPAHWTLEDRGKEYVVIHKLHISK